MQDTEKTPAKSPYELMANYRDDVVGLVAAVSSNSGISPDEFYAVGMTESSLKADAKAKTSSATGLFQFTKGTWKDQIARYGSKLGIPEGTAPTDPVANALLAAQYIKESKVSYQKNLGGEPTLGDVYLGHFLGATGRNNFVSAMRANPNAKVEDVISKGQYEANPQLHGKTVQQVHEMYNNKLSNFVQRFKSLHATKPVDANTPKPEELKGKSIKDVIEATGISQAQSSAAIPEQPAEKAPLPEGAAQPTVEPQHRGEPQQHLQPAKQVVEQQVQPSDTTKGWAGSEADEWEKHTNAAHTKKDLVEQRIINRLREKEEYTQQLLEADDELLREVDSLMTKPFLDGATSVTDTSNIQDLGQSKRAFEEENEAFKDLWETSKSSFMSSYMGMYFSKVAGILGTTPDDPEFGDIMEALSTTTLADERSRLSEIKNLVLDYLPQNLLLRAAGYENVDTAIEGVMKFAGYENIEADTKALLEPSVEITPEIAKALEAKGLDPKWFPFVAVATSKEHFIKRVEIALEQQKNAKVKAEANTGSMVVGMLAEAAGDPTMLFGATGILKNMGIAAAGSVAYDTMLKVDTKGAIDNDLMEGAVASVVLSGLLGSAGKGLTKFFSQSTVPSAADARILSNAEALSKGDEVSKAQSPDAIPEGNKWDLVPDEADAVVLKDGTIVSGANPTNPAMKAEVDEWEKVLELYSNGISKSGIKKRIASNSGKKPKGKAAKARAKKKAKEFRESGAQEAAAGRISGSLTDLVNEAKLARAKIDTMEEFGDDYYSDWLEESLMGGSTTTPSRSSDVLESSDAYEVLDEPLDDAVKGFFKGEEPNIVEMPKTSDKPVLPNADEAEKTLGLHVRMGKFTDLGITLAGDANPEVRKMGALLTRAHSGMKQGGSGRAAMTAEDIIAMEEGIDFQFANNLYKAIEDLTENNILGLSKGGATAKDSAMREFIELHEAGRTDLMSPEQKRLSDLLGNHMERKHGLATNTAQFGIEDAAPVFESKRNPRTYVSLVYDKGKKFAMEMKLGGAGKLKEHIKANFETQWRLNVGDVKAKYLDKFAKELDEFKAKHKSDVTKAAKKAASKGEDYEAPVLTQKELDDYLEMKVMEDIEATAHGIAMQDHFTYNSMLSDVDIQGSLVGAENNRFSDARNVFDPAYRTPDEVGGEFSLNDIRNFDLQSVTGLYNRRMNGDIGIHGATGMTTRDFKNMIVALPEGRGKEALKQTVLAATGRNRLGRETTAMDMVFSSMNDLAMGSKGARIWTTQLTEIAGQISRGITDILKNGGDELSNLFNPQHSYNRATLKEFQAAFFGDEFNMNLQGSFEGYTGYLRERGYNRVVSSTVGAARTATQVFAQKSPLTKLLQHSTTMMVNKARGGVIADITNDAFGTGSKFRPEQLKAADITPKQYEDIKAMMKEHVTVNSRGQYVPNVQGVLSDPRRFDFWRLCDYIASDAVFRPNKLGKQYTRQPSPAMSIVVMFKSFMIKAINGRLCRSLNEAGNGKKLDLAVRSFVTIGIGAAVHAMKVHHNAYSLPEKDRQAYKDRMLSRDMLAYNALTTSELYGSAMGAINMTGSLLTGSDLFTMARTTTSLKSQRDNARIGGNAVNSRNASEEMLKRLGDVVPALTPTASLLNAPVQGIKAFTADYGADADRNKAALMDNLKNVLPNDPILQLLIGEMGAEFGVATR